MSEPGLCLECGAFKTRTVSKSVNIRLQDRDLSARGTIVITTAAGGPALHSPILALHSFVKARPATFELAIHFAVRLPRLYEPSSLRFSVDRPSVAR